MWWGHGGWGWGAWLAMSLMMVVLWTLVIWAVFAVTRAGVACAPTRSRTPEQILAERLARGEIDQDDYQQRLDALHGSKPSQPHNTETP